MTEQVIILGYSTYSFEDEKTKRLIEGTTVHIISTTHQNDEYGVGYLPKRVTMPKDFSEYLEGLSFPHVAEPVMVHQFTSKGPKAIVKSFQIKQPLQFSSLDQNDKSIKK